MLTISKPISASQAVTYHAEKFTNGAENYYAASPTIPGQWHGQLAQTFGLTGDVDAAQFRRLAEGHHPITDAPLLQARTATPYINARGTTVSPMAHRAGWDATFSAPKSVSLVALVGGDDRVRLAHRAAVATALQALEPYTQARLGGSRPAETSGQWVAATFEHDSARPVNGYAAPQLHTHTVIFNLTSSSEDRIRPIQPRELYKSQQFATAVYRSALARQLRTLGYTVERGTSQQPEIRGFTKDYLDASSPRRQQILAQLERAQRSGAGAAQIAAHQTREAKIQHAHADMQRRHQDLAAAFDHQPARAVAAAHVRGHQVQPDAPERAVTAVTFAKHRNLEREAVVDERALFRDALQHAMGEVSVPRIQSAFDDRIRAGDFLHRTQKGSAARAFTTPEMVVLERDMLQAMRAGQGQHRELVTARTRAAIDVAHPHLNAGQRAAVQQILASRDTVTGLNGVAGAGKTTALTAVRAAAEQEGYRVEGLAPTSRAAQTLVDAGLKSRTLQRHLVQPPNPEGGGKTLYVVDESSLASTGQMHTFLTRLRPDDRVLLVGDVRQHQSVDAGRAFEQLQEAGLQVTPLDTIVRQQDPAYRRVVEQLSRGDIRPALRDLDAQHRIHEIPNRDARIQAIATTFSARPAGTLVVAPDNQSRMELNAAIHDALTADGHVRNRPQHTRVLVPRQDMTGVDRAQAHRYHEGDVIRYSQGSAARGMKAGDYATVERIDAEANQLTVRHASTGAAVTYDPQRLRGVSVYRESERAFAIGDRLQFTAPFRDQHVANRELGTITALTPATMKVQLDSGRSIRFNSKDYAHVDYGYAVTSHSSQGHTAERVIVHIDTDRAGEALVNQRLAYVALSRGQLDAQIYTNDKTQLAHALSRDVSHRSAVEPSRDSSQRVAHGPRAARQWAGLSQ